MKYAISILTSETPTYEKERYSTFEEAEKAYLAIPEEERGNFGISEIHSDEEVAELNKALEKENENVES